MKLQAIRADITNSLREIQSRNVAAKLTGSHPERRDEVVLTSILERVATVRDIEAEIEARAKAAKAPAPEPSAT